MINCQKTTTCRITNYINNDITKSDNGLQMAFLLVSSVAVESFDYTIKLSYIQLLNIFHRLEL